MARRKRRKRVDLFLNIIKKLQTDGPLTKYRLQKALDIDAKNMFYLVKDLEQLGHVKVMKTGTSRSKKPMNYYDLTLLGVFALLQSNEGYIIRKLASKYATYLPLVFGKWDHFIKYGVEDMASTFLWHIIRVPKPVSPQHRSRNPHYDYREIVKLRNSKLWIHIQPAFTTENYIQMIHQCFFFGDEMVKADYEIFPGIDDPYHKWRDMILADHDLLTETRKIIDENIKKKQDELKIYQGLQKYVFSSERV